MERRRWTLEEVEVLKIMVEDGYAASHIGQVLGRTVNQIEKKRRMEGLRGKASNADCLVLTDEYVEEVRERARKAISKYNITVTKDKFKHWSDAAVGDLKRLVMVGLTDEQIAERLGTTRKSVEYKRGKLGINKRASFNEWSNEDIEQLKTMYCNGFNDKQIADSLNRTWSAVDKKRKDLGLSRKNDDDWTEEEERFLKEHAEIRTTDELAQKLKRTPQSISHKAQRLDVNLSGKQFWAEDKVDIVRGLVKEGKCLREIANIFNITKMAVHQVCEKHDIWYDKERGMHVNFDYEETGMWTTEEEKIVKNILEMTKDYDKTAELTGIPRNRISAKNRNTFHVKGIPNNLGDFIEYKDTVYRSRFEIDVVKIFYKRGVNFIYERSVCKDRLWTCDFYLPDFEVWIEADGLMEKRKGLSPKSYQSYKDKIDYYKENNFNYIIVTPKNYKRKINEFLDGDPEDII